MNESLPLCPEDDRNVKQGVLTSDEIGYCVDKFELIKPFDKKKLLNKPARYQLTLGEDYAIGGELKKLYEEPGKNELKIDPFQVAIVSTKETLNMPRFLIARWNLHIDLVYEGLLWVGGPQVDPGYYGKLLCPLYNLSNETVTLKLGDKIASIDFVKTTPFVKGKTNVYPRPPKKIDISDYNWRLRSALYTLEKEKIDRLEKELERTTEKLERTTERVNRSMASIFTVLGILIAAISLVLTNVTWFIPLWGWCAIWFSVAALILVFVPPKTIGSTIKKWFQDPNDPHSS